MFPRFGISALVILLCLCAPVLLASQRVSDTPPTAQEQTAQLASATGRIVSVQGNTFTVETAKTPESADVQAQQDAPKTMTFTIDQSTKVDGKIQVGADADVTYRQQEGNNIAVSVRVSPPQS